MTDTAISLTSVKKSHFKRIGLMGRAGKKSIITTLNELIHLLTQWGLDIAIDTNTASIDGIHIGGRDDHIKIVPRGRMGEYCDLVMVVGGDGSILQASTVLAGTGVPVLGVNRG